MLLVFKVIGIIALLIIEFLAVVFSSALICGFEFCPDTASEMNSTLLRVALGGIFLLVDGIILYLMFRNNGKK